MYLHADFFYFKQNLCSLALTFFKSGENMKRLITLYISISLLCGMASFALAAGMDNDFVLVNRTGYTLDSVFVSPAKSNDWGDDVMGRNVVVDGDEVLITFHPSEGHSIYDLQIVYDDGTAAVWPNLKLPDIDTLTIRYDRVNDVTTATAE